MFTEHPTSGKLLLMLTSSYEPLPFLDSFSAERLDFRGFSSDFEESVVSQDYWKLAQDYRTGAWGWQEDGELDFDLSMIGLGEDLSPEEMEAVLAQWQNVKNSMFDTPTISAASSPDDIINRSDAQMLALSEKLSSQTMSIENYNSMNLNSFLGSPFLNQRNDFLNGTEALIDGTKVASSLVDKLSNTSMAHKQGINEEQINNQIALMNQNLMTADGHGVIIKNGYQTHNGGGTIFALGEGESSYMTSDYGWRVTAWDSAFYEAYELQNHEYWDLWATEGNRGLMSTEAGSMELGYGRAGGLTSVFTANSGLDRLTYKHQSAQTVMEYLSVFGMSGTSLNFDGQGYSLSGIRDNTVIGHMGNTGTETSGAHLHMGYEFYDMDEDLWIRTNPSDYSEFQGLRDSMVVTSYAENLSGWESPVWTPDRILQSNTYRQSWGANDDFGGNGFSMGGLFTFQGDQFDDDTWEWLILNGVNF